ncbi:putative polyglutamate biosynthesis protein [Lophiotrema nucula]|uniref:Putative polyglutamate biosynthesis protein n=1 Tax=Lophiotrema nucula TaxID=690887 RepID=A0A6A5ZCV0_9PLEO|nr:putative polyglutamate biosynthesis protein [Lophiotrema nucula]
MAPPTRFHLNFVGDVMLGRLVDQLLPTHVHNPEEAAYVAKVVASNPHLKNYDYKSPWGNTLPLFHSSHLNLINLETSATTHAKPWPDKVFNYRTHPANVQCLREARIGYASLANNHTLDFCGEALLETVRMLKDNGIQFAGAGETEEEARRPAVLDLRDGEEKYQVDVWSVSDHPEDWSIVPNFHLIDYTSATRLRLKQLHTLTIETERSDLKIFSVHWGPNYSWTPSDDIRSLAHFLVDECDVDIVHGHSSHHVQGVEVYKGKLIIYGCGDFVDDYAVKHGHRNDLSAVWRVGLEVNQGDVGKRLKVKRLEVFPSRIKHFQANLLPRDDEDHQWVADKLRVLSKSFGTEAQEELGVEGQIVVHIS